MCQQFFLRHWLCEYTLQTTYALCEHGTTAPGTCPASQEECLVEGDCPRCTPGVKPQPYPAWGMRFPQIDELVLDSDSIIADWDKVVAIFSPEDQKLFGLVKSGDHNAPTPAVRKTLTPKIRKSRPSASQRAPPASQRDPSASQRDPSASQRDPLVSQRTPSVGHYRNLSNQQPRRNNASQANYETHPQYWDQKIFIDDPIPKQKQVGRNCHVATPQHHETSTPMFQPAQRPTSLPADQMGRLEQSPSGNVSFSPTTGFPQIFNGLFGLPHHQQLIPVHTQGLTENSESSMWPVYEDPQFGGYIE